MKIVSAYITLLITLVGCSTSHQEYLKYDSLNFIYINIFGDELNSFDNKYYLLYKGKYLAYNVNIGTVDKIKLFDTLEEINFFDIADSIEFNTPYRTRYSKLYIQQFGYGKEINWNTDSLENSKYKTEIEKLSKIIDEIKKDNLKDKEFPKRGSIW